MKSILFYFILIISFAYCRINYNFNNLEQKTAYVEYNEGTYSIVFQSNPSNQPAYGSYNDTVNENGWSLLRITTNNKFDDKIQAYAAGYLEAYLTHHRIYQHYKNFFISSNFSPKLQEYIKENKVFLSEQIKDTSVPFNYHLSLVLEQSYGLTDGYKLFAPEEEQLSDDEIYHIIHYSDIRDLENLLNGKLNEYDHCSAIIKVLDDNDDIIITHTTWTKYLNI